MITETYFSQSSVNWLTNCLIRDLVKKSFGGQIDLDPCPSTIPSNWFARENWPLGGPMDSLRASWTLKGLPTKIFVNPPFGTSYINGTQCIGRDEHKELPDNQIELWKKQTLLMWAEKCVLEKKQGNEIVWLSKTALENKALQTVLGESSAICIPKGRTSYLDPVTNCEPDSTPTFGSVLLYLGNLPGPFIKVFSELGITRILS